MVCFHLALQAYGLTPQFFLPHPDAVRVETPNSLPSLSSEKRPQGTSLLLPPGVLDTLEVFVLNYKELSQRMRLLRQQEKQSAVGNTVEDQEAGVHSRVLVAQGC